MVSQLEKKVSDLSRKLQYEWGVDGDCAQCKTMVITCHNLLGRLYCMVDIQCLLFVKVIDNLDY